MEIFERKVVCVAIMMKLKNIHLVSRKKIITKSRQFKKRALSKRVTSHHRWCAQMVNKDCFLKTDPPGNHLIARTINQLSKNEIESQNFNSK